MENLKVIAKNKSGKILFESENVESVLNWALTILYDGQVKIGDTRKTRAKVDVSKYYDKDGKDYTKIIGEYDDNINPGGKLIYIVTGFRNDWGNFINVQNTFTDNKIKLYITDENFIDLEVDNIRHSVKAVAVGQNKIIWYYPQNEVNSYLKSRLLELRM